MRKLLFLLPLYALLTACPPPMGMNITGSHAPPYGYEGEFSQKPVPKRLWATPLEVAGHFVGNYPEGEEGNPVLDVKMTKGLAADGKLTLYITAMGYLDDAVRGEQWRIKLNQAGEGWGVEQAESRWMCQRGPDSARWVTAPCP